MQFIRRMASSNGYIFLYCRFETGHSTAELQRKYRYTFIQDVIAPRLVLQDEFRIFFKMSVVSVKDSDACTRHFKLNKDLKRSTG